MIWIAIGLVLLGSLVFFRWRLRRLRKLFCTDVPCKVAADTVHSATVAMRSELARLSNDPDSDSKLSSLRNGQVAIKSLALMLLLLTVFLAGGEIRERTFREGVMPDEVDRTPIARAKEPDNNRAYVDLAVDVSGRKGVGVHGQFDSKLAELREAPTLATVSWFDRERPTPERRAEVLAVLRPLCENESKSIRLVAAGAIRRWE